MDERKTPITKLNYKVVPKNKFNMGANALKVAEVSRSYFSNRQLHTYEETLTDKDETSTIHGIFGFVFFTET